MKYLDTVRAALDAATAKRDGALAAMEATVEKAGAEARAVLTADEDAAYRAASDTLKAADAEVASLKARAAELEVVEARATADASRRAPLPGMAGDPFEVRGAISGADARARALTAIERSNKFVSDSHREAVSALISQRGTIGEQAARLTLLTGSDAYERGWSKYMSGDHFGLTQEEREALSRGKDTTGERATFGVEARAVTSGTGASGGFFVPVYVDPTLVITGAGAVNPLRDISTVKQIGPAFGGWYGATAAQVTAAWTAEGTAAPDNTPVVAQPNIPVYMAEAFAAVSYQAFEDIADLAGDLLALFADAKVNLEAVAHQTGTGTGQPTGVMTAVSAIAGSRVATAGVGALALADVFSLHKALPARFRNTQTQGGEKGRYWIGNIGILDQIRTLAMAQNSANSVWTDIRGGVPSTLLGDNVLEASQLSASIATGQDILLYGDFTRYYIVDRIGFTTEFIPNVFDTATGRPTAQRGWISHWRTGANAVDTNGFRDLRVA